MVFTGRWYGIKPNLEEHVLKFVIFCFRNVATNWMGRATIVAGTAGQQYVDNIFENPDNDYEIITVNSTM